MLQDLASINWIVQKQLDQILDSFIISSWKGNYSTVAQTAPDCYTAALLYALLVDHPRLP